MDPKELEIVLEKHKKWLFNEPGGERANLREANLAGTDLEGANLAGTDLEGANLRRTNLARANLRRTNLRSANLRRTNLAGANLRETNLEGANLREANLRLANLKGANLRLANLKGANLAGAEIDYSAWPLWCYSLDVHVDERQVAQLLYHVLSLVKYSKHISEETKQLLMTKNNLAVALKFHRADECERLSMEDAENDKQK